MSSSPESTVFRILCDTKSSGCTSLLTSRALWFDDLTA
jgi:hypothetical protein